MLETLARPEHGAPANDLRGFIAQADAAGEILHVPAANWDLEMGALAEAVSHKRPEAPALLFEDIIGYPHGPRVISGTTNSSLRIALTFNFPIPKKPLDLVRAYRDRMKTHRPIPPRVVASGPVLENVDRDEQVDLWKFPVPRVHEGDGGRYIGTGDCIIMRDPETGWVNMATYRVQVHDKNTISIWISPGKHGRQIREKYTKMGKPCPVLISVGQHPLLFLCASHEVRYGLGELDFAGGHRGEAIDVIESELHGLPMPADAEIVLEGEISLDEKHDEGPFGEFTGYYANPQSAQPIVKVKRVYYRNDPILTMAVPMRPPTDLSFGKAIVKAGLIWDQVELAGLAGVQGVWNHEVGIGRMFNVISIKQAYAGHAKQAGLLAAGCHAGAYLGRFVVVVDEDVDPTDLFDVMWAMCTRCDPAQDIDIIRNMWSSPLDPRIPRDAKAWTNSRAIIDATRPYESLKEFPKVARSTPELLERVKTKFADVLAKV